MPRKKSPQNKPYPERWRVRHNKDGSASFYFQVPPGMEAHWDGKKTFLLGHTLAEAHAEFARRTQSSEIEPRTIGQLLDRYAAEVVPRKAAKTRQDNARQIAQLRAVFGELPIEAMQPSWVYKYVDRRRNKVTGERALVAAKREIEVLSHAYTQAVRWGLIPRHPFKNELELEGEKPRQRYVEDWEIAEALSLKPAREKGSVLAIQAYIRLKLVTGMRRADLLQLKECDIGADGIHVATSKTGKEMIFAWEIDGVDMMRREPVAMARAAKPAQSEYLFCTRTGEPYWNFSLGEPRGWKSMWQRFMARVLAETKVKERFTDHDLRRKAGSDKESLEAARRLLGHVDPATTNRIYRAKPEVT